MQYGTRTRFRRITAMLQDVFGTVVVKKVKVVNLYSASSRIHASNALSSLTRAAGRPATACSLET